jgi:putative glutamine amidotransferase
VTRGAPLVGLTTYVDEARWGPWDRPAVLVPATYVEMVAGTGGLPVLLPPLPGAPGGLAARARDAVAALDALVLIGGGDVDPSTYGAPPHPRVEGVAPARDLSELALLDAVLARDLPLLAICRGLQLLNVHLGGTLFAHLPEQLGHDGHRPAPGRFARTEVVTVPGTVTAAVMGPRAAVRCSHHQSVDRLGRGLVVAARSVEPMAAAPGVPGAGPGEIGPAPGGVVEAVELPAARFVVGVQWHPEEAGDGRLVEALLAAAR